MDNPLVLNYVRAGYVIVQLIAIFVYMYTSSVVRRSLCLVFVCHSCMQFFVVLDQEEERSDCVEVWYVEVLRSLGRLN